MIKRIGLLGGIGSGKSYVADIFNKKYDVPVYNSDYRAKYLMVNNQELREEIIKYFGKDSFVDNQINKEKFNKLLFENKESLLLMNSIVTPAIEKDFELFCTLFDNPYVLKESAILLETGTYIKMDKIICVVSDVETRIKRAIERGGTTREIILKKIKNQSTDEEKIKISDYVIYNNENLIEQIDNIHKLLIKNLVF